MVVIDVVIQKSLKLGQGPYKMKREEHIIRLKMIAKTINISCFFVNGILITSFLQHFNGIKKMLFYQYFNRSFYEKILLFG
jgi:hypothetical protein